MCARSYINAEVEFEIDDTMLGDGGIRAADFDEGSSGNLPVYASVNMALRVTDAPKKIRGGMEVALRTAQVEASLLRAQLPETMKAFCDMMTEYALNPDKDIFKTVPGHSEEGQEEEEEEQEKSAGGASKKKKKKKGKANRTKKERKQDKANAELERVVMGTKDGEDVVLKNTRT